MKVRLLLTGSALTIGVMTGPALAQETPAPGSGIATATNPDDSQGEIIITARRRDERLADVPTAVSVIDAASLRDRGGATDTRELLADQPSVRFNNLNSTVTSEISIRASSTARATNGDPSVGLYRDGAYIGGGAIGGRNFTRLDLLDIGRVEVLRGTQGALYGRNAVGGAINIVSAQPEFENSFWLHGRYDFETDAIQGQGAVNLKLTDGVAIRVSGDGINQNKGFFYNPDHDVYFDRQKGYGARGQIRVKTGPLDLVLLAETQDMTIPTISYQIAIPRGTPGYPGGFIQPEFSYAWSTRPRASQGVRTFQGLATLDLGGATLTSTTSYRYRNSQYDLDNDGTDAAEAAAARARGDVIVTVDTAGASYVIDRTKNFTQDLHLAGKAVGGRLAWLVGADLVDLTSRYQVTTTRTPTPANPSKGTRAPATLKYKSYSAYGSLGYDLTDSLNLTGELRYTKDDRSLSARLFDLGTGVPVGGAARVIDAETKPDNIAYNATLSYKLGGGVLTYAKVGSSYRAGGFNSNLGDLRQPIPIQAAYGNENSTSYEIGIRGAPTRGLYFAAAGYYTNLKNLIAQTDNGCAVTNPVCPVAATTFLTNAGDARSYGVEAELTNVLPVANGQFRFTLSASWQGGKVTSGKFKDFRLPQVPDWLASWNVNFRHKFIGDTTLIANALLSAQFGGLQELRVNSVKLDDYALVNLRLGIEMKPVTVSLFANNVTNDVYRVAHDTTINRYSIPRVFGIEGDVRW